MDDDYCNTYFKSNLFIKHKYIITHSMFYIFVHFAFVKKLYDPRYYYNNVI